MITVTGRQVREIEYLISQSIQGHHVLFDESAVRSVLKRNQHRAPIHPDSPEQKECEQRLERMLELPTLAQKRAFLEKLSTRDFEGLVRLWFNVVENSLFQSSHERH